MGAFSDVTANDINSIARTMGVINRNKIYRDENKRRQGEFDRVETERDHTQAGLGALQSGEEMPSNISPSSKANAKTAFAKQKGAESTVIGHEDDINTMNRVNEIYASMGSKGVTDRRAFLKEMPVESSIDMRAMLSIQQQLGQNEKFAYEGMQQSAKVATEHYNQHKSQLSSAQNLMASGNMDLAERSLFDAVNKTPHPVYIEKNAQGTYDLYYEEFGQEKELVEGGLNMEQAIGLIGKIPQENAVQNMTHDMVEAKNKNGQAKFATWKNEAGEEVEVLMQYDPNNPREAVPQIFKKNGPRTEGSIDTLRQSGFRPVAGLADQKIQSEIGKNSAMGLKYKQEAKGAGAKGAKDMADLQGKLLDNDKKSLNMMLTPFHGGKAALFNAAGDDFSDAGKAALQKAMEFVEKYSQEENLSATEKMKLNKATQAIQMWDGMSRGIAKGKGIQDIKEPPPGSSKEAKAALAARENGKMAEYLKSLPPDIRKKVVAELRKIKPPEKKEDTRWGRPAEAQETTTPETYTQTQGVHEGDALNKQSGAMEAADKAPKKPQVRGQYEKPVNILKGISDGINRLHKYQKNHPIGS